MARSVQVEADAPLMESIVFTGEESWAERDLEGWTATGNAKFDKDDLLGPISLMVAGERRGEQPAHVPGFIIAQLIGAVAAWALCRWLLQEQK